MFVREDRETSSGNTNSSQYHHHRRNHNGNTSVYVWNLDTDTTTWQTLKDHMRSAGNVHNVTILEATS